MAYTTINKSTEHFNAKIYTGTGSSQSITGVGFQPDLVWTKARNGVNSHLWYDKVRGVHKYLRSDKTAAEGNDTNTLTSFDSDGFTVGDGDNSNASGANGVAWNWKANGAGSSNTDGDVTSTVSVNTTSGFSIVKWDSTGTAGINIGHGLGQKPAMIIAKSTNIGTTNWPVYHQSLGATKYLSFNTTTLSTTSATRWNNSEPTTTTFQTGSSGDIGGSDRTMIAYCFANIQGYSKFGSYTGNGNADGTFVYTGFKPAFVIVKRSSDTQSWVLWDSKRDGYNQTNPSLTPNEDGAEETRSVDFLSNGFKNRQNNTATNAASTYIYMAFAEHPFTSSTGTPVTAR